MSNNNFGSIYNTPSRFAQTTKLAWSVINNILMSNICINLIKYSLITYEVVQTILTTAASINEILKNDHNTFSKICEGIDLLSNIYNKIDHHII